MIGAEREVFVKLRDGRYIDDEMLRTLLRRWTWRRPRLPGGGVGRPGPGAPDQGNGRPVTTAATVLPRGKAPSPARVTRA